MLAHHPDKNPGDAGAASRFRAACDAYSILEESLGVSDDDLSLAARRGTASFDELNRLFERMAACQAKVDSLRGEIDSLQLEVDEIADAAQKAMAPARGDPRARRAALESEARDDLAQAKARAKRRARDARATREWWGAGTTDWMSREPVAFAFAKVFFRRRRGRSVEWGTCASGATGREVVRSKSIFREHWRACARTEYS